MQKRDAGADLKLCDAATPGPWYREKTGATFKGLSTEIIIADTAPCCTENRIYADAGDSYPASDADFIALAREALPYWIERAQELEKSCVELLAGQFKKRKNKTLGDTVISDACGLCEIDIKVGDRIICNDELAWHEHKKEKHLTLKEIYEQVRAKGYDGVIYVWEEMPLEGTIYQCGNYKEGEWVEHGTTRGYA